MPSKAIVFGSRAPVRFILVPLKKGLTVKRIEVKAQEVIITRCGLGYNGVEDPPKIRYRLCEKDTFDVPEGTETTDLGDGNEGFEFTRHVQLPRNLADFSPDFVSDTLRWRIKHEVHYAVSLRNPEGHISRIEGKIPCVIYMAPYLRVNNRSELEGPARNPNPDDGGAAPPLYGEHQYDSIYSEVDQSGFMTPGIVSGATTPRRASQLQSGLAGINAEEDTELPDINPAERADLNVNTLQNRLISLDDTIQARAVANELSHHASPLPQQSPEHENPAYFPPPATFAAVDSTLMPGQTRPGTPIHVEDYDAEELAKVPSYQTAVQPKPIVSSAVSGLPTYEQTLSRPPSPGTQILGRTPPAPGMQVYGRTPPSQGHSGLLSGHQSYSAPEPSTSGSRTPVASAHGGPSGEHLPSRRNHNTSGSQTPTTPGHGGSGGVLGKLGNLFGKYHQ